MSITAVAGSFGPVNYVVLGTYLTVLVAIGFHFAKREKSTDDFFLAGRRIPWWAAGLSIFGTQLSAITYLAMPARAYATDWTLLILNIGIFAIAPFVIYLYLPFFRRLNITTAYEYLEKRFNVSIRLFGSLSFVAFQLGRMGIVVLLPALALSAVTGLNVYLCIALMGILSTVYTVLGGIEAVIWTDVLQAVVLIGGAFIALGIIVGDLDGGFRELVSVAVENRKFNLAHLNWDWTSDALIVVVLGAIFTNSLVPYTTDQAVIQRYLTTPDEKQAAKAIWLNRFKYLQCPTVKVTKLRKGEKMKKNFFRVVIYSVFIIAPSAYSGNIQHSYKDRPYLQDFAEKIPLSEELAGTELSAVRSDRNGRILVLSNNGLLQIHNGKLVRDQQNRPLLDMQIRNMDAYREQFVYLTDKDVLSNAWAGQFYIPHKMPDVRLFKMGSEFDFLVSSEDALAYFEQGKCVDKWETTQRHIKQLFFDPKRNRFLILSNNQLDCFSPGKKVIKVFEAKNLNCLELMSDNTVLIIGTQDGYIELDANSFHQRSALQKELPCADIRCVRQIGEKVWFGTSRGAFALHSDGQIDYYASKRWLVDDTVIDLSKGPDNCMLILGPGGLSIIHFKKMTLQQKAEHFDKLTRKRHVRYGLNSALTLSKSGDLSTGTLIDQDNDGLWTSMYLAGELFRYAVTKSEDALQNCYESFEAMERLSYINPLEGFPSRSFERSGYKLADKSRWRPAEDRTWDWKATTSSDEIVGHFFVYSIFAEVIPNEKWRDRAITLMDSIMDHIMRNDWYLIDYDGKPTLWGKWNPDYVNQFPKQVGDRRLNSVEIIAFLQTAYHFTDKEIYKEKAFELMEKYGYLDNIMIPISKIGRVPGIHLTTEWNHSDDELAFLSYWNLYKYAFTDELREKYRQAIKGHWEIERPEKNPLWNLIYAVTGATDFDLEETIWSLKEFPLDTIGWSVRNNHRKDLKFMAPNFRNQTTRKVLPPDERPMSKYNGNHFRLDGGEGGHREYSGDIFLLPYWLGRYLQKIR